MDYEEMDSELETAGIDPFDFALMDEVDSPPVRRMCLFRPLRQGRPRPLASVIFPALTAESQNMTLRQRPHPLLLHPQTQDPKRADCSRNKEQRPPESKAP